MNEVSRRKVRSRSDYFQPAAQTVRVAPAVRSSPRDFLFFREMRPCASQPTTARIRYDYGTTTSWPWLWVIPLTYCRRQRSSNPQT